MFIRRMNCNYSFLEKIKVILHKSRVDELGKKAMAFYDSHDIRLAMVYGLLGDRFFNDVWAQVVLGDIFQFVKESKSNVRIENKSFDWYYKAALQNNSYALYFIGIMLYDVYRYRDFRYKKGFSTLRLNLCNDYLLYIGQSASLGFSCAQEFLFEHHQFVRKGLYTELAEKNKKVFLYNISGEYKKLNKRGTYKVRLVSRIIGDDFIVANGNKYIVCLFEAENGKRYSCFAFERKADENESSSYSHVFALGITDYDFSIKNDVEGLWFLIKVGAIDKEIYPNYYKIQCVFVEQIDSPWNNVPQCQITPTYRGEIT